VDPAKRSGSAGDKRFRGGRGGRGRGGEKRQVLAHVQLQVPAGGSCGKGNPRWAAETKGRGKIRSVCRGLEGAGQKKGDREKRVDPCKTGSKPQYG